MNCFVLCSFVDNLKLEEHSKKQSKKLSGGTKRKVNSIIFSVLTFFDLKCFCTIAVTGTGIIWGGAAFLFLRWREDGVM